MVLELLSAGLDARINRVKIGKALWARVTTSETLTISGIAFELGMLLTLRLWSRKTLLEQLLGHRGEPGALLDSLGSGAELFVSTYPDWALEPMTLARCIISPLVGLPPVTGASISQLFATQLAAHLDASDVRRSLTVVASVGVGYAHGHRRWAQQWFRKYDGFNRQTVEELCVPGVADWVHRHFRSAETEAGFGCWRGMDPWR